MTDQGLQEGPAAAGEPAQVWESRGHVQSDLPQRCFGPPQLEATLLRQAHLRKILRSQRGDARTLLPLRPRMRGALSGFVWPRVSLFYLRAATPFQNFHVVSKDPDSSLKTPGRVLRRSERSFGFMLRSSSATNSSPGCTDLVWERRRKAGRYVTTSPDLSTFFLSIILRENFSSVRCFFAIRECMIFLLTFFFSERMTSSSKYHDVLRRLLVFIDFFWKLFWFLCLIHISVTGRCMIFSFLFFLMTSNVAQSTMTCRGVLWFIKVVLSLSDWWFSIDDWKRSLRGKNVKRGIRFAIFSFSTGER